MPNKDGTGPEGKGPKTGRQKGKCKGAVEDTEFRRGPGRRPRRRE
ncbi:DUF5320 domain-containing protein [Candidatus Pacearchaeota archaeon]|nr:DUF5320 domain-containing protein [Candidatus Pacearchaeota archaeon]